MGRLHSKGKGISASAIPYSRSVPTWFKSSPEQIVDNICKLAKKGATPSQIGVVLRDSHGVAQVKVVTGELGSNRCVEGVESRKLGWALTSHFGLREQNLENIEEQWYARILMLLWQLPASTSRPTWHQEQP